jgi:hypothetical protein
MRSVVKQRAANPGKSNAEILKAILIRQRAPGKAGVEVERRAQG